MIPSEALRDSRIQLTHGSSAIPVAGSGPLIRDLAETKEAVKAALGLGYRLNRPAR